MMEKTEKFIVKKFIFNGWKDFLKIQKDKSYDLAVVFIKNQKLNNLPTFSKVQNTKIMVFWSINDGLDDQIVKKYNDYFNKQKSFTLKYRSIKLNTCCDKTCF